MIIETVASPIQEEIDIITAENVQVVLISNETILTTLKVIVKLLLFLAILGIFLFFLLV